jgi:hypothetical protein
LYGVSAATWPEMVVVVVVGSASQAVMVWQEVEVVVV